MAELLVRLMTNKLRRSYKKIKQVAFSNLYPAAPCLAAMAFPFPSKPIFKASALWADAFYKSKCPYVCLFVCLCVHF